MLQRLMCQDAFELIEATQVAAALFINRHAQARANKPDGASAARRWQASTESRKLARQGLWDLQQARHAWLHGRPREAHLLVELARARIASITLAFALPLARQAAKQRTSQRTSRTAQQAARLARHIARLARSGMAPAEIAAELDVSTKTVTRHLRKSSGHT
jgi:DNA-binding CsgD family transcriptional regulator